MARYTQIQHVGGKPIETVSDLLKLICCFNPSTHLSEIPIQFQEFDVPDIEEKD